jgi:hypothetical protein
MTRIAKSIPLALALALGLLAAAAQAQDFSPEASFDLSDRSVRGNPEVTISVSQDEGEEELKSVLLRYPAGFKLATDAALMDGEQLGSGDITIDAGPRCAGAVGSAPINVAVDIIERDRTQDEIDHGVKAVYVVDLEPVTTIDLLVRGSRAQGWKLSGKIPSNDLTCPPFAFVATLFQRAADSGTRIIVNPSDAGRYVLSIRFNGLEGSHRTIRQTVRIHD